ncbi:MAG: GerMN domain-containing protein [Patescibacteria group bacterium]|nr:GerMN domain-containing protein [Patescibacteria group bacterium]
MYKKGFANLMVVIIVILVSVAGYFVLTGKKTEAPVDVVPSTPQLTATTTSQTQVATTSTEEIIIIQNIIQNWDNLQTNIPFSPVLGSVVWNSPSEFKFIGNNQVLVGFDDGHIVGASIFKFNNNNNIEYITAFLNKDKEQWAIWAKANADMSANNYTRQVVRNGKFVNFSDWTMVPENQFEWLYTQNDPETMSIKIFLVDPRHMNEPPYDCTKTVAVERKISKTQEVARAALTELIKGATQNEIDQGFFSNINAGVKIQSLSIKNRIAKVDFNEQLQAGIGGSCATSAIRSQIRETLKQFLTVDNVIVSINGRIEDILQP